MISIMNAKQAKIRRDCVECKKSFTKQNPTDYTEMWCDKCMISMMERDMPEKWAMVQKWKKDLDEAERQLI